MLNRVGIIKTIIQGINPCDIKSERTTAGLDVFLKIDLDLIVFVLNKSSSYELMDITFLVVFLDITFLVMFPTNGSLLIILPYSFVFY